MTRHGALRPCSAREAPPRALARRRFLLSTAPVVHRLKQAKSIICMPGSRAEIAQKVPRLGERDNTHHRTIGIAAKSECLRTSKRFGRFGARRAQCAFEKRRAAELTGSVGPLVKAKSIDRFIDEPRADLERRPL